MSMLQEILSRNTHLSFLLKNCSLDSINNNFFAHNRTVHKISILNHLLKFCHIRSYS